MWTTGTSPLLPSFQDSPPLPYLMVVCLVGCFSGRSEIKLHAEEHVRRKLLIICLTGEEKEREEGGQIPNVHFKNTLQVINILHSSVFYRVPTAPPSTSGYQFFKPWSIRGQPRSQLFLHVYIYTYKYKHKHCYQSFLNC